MQQKRNDVTALCMVALAVSLVCLGCGGQQYGKYNEEQMQQIGLANKYDLPAPSGSSMVLAVHSETISSDDILAITEKAIRSAAAEMDESDFKQQVRPIVRETIRGKVTDILLYQEARKTAPEDIDDLLEKAVDSEVNRFVASYGNNYALAESRIKEMGMNWRSFREYQKKMIMTQSYISSKFNSGKRFSYQELLNFYEQNKYEIPNICTESSVGFSVIDIQPDLLTTEQRAAGEDAQAAAERLAGELIARLHEGADFAELAKQYHGSLAGIGGKFLPVKIEDDSLTEPYRSLKDKAVQMQPEQVAGPISLDRHVFVMKLDTLQAGGCKPFEEVQLLIEQLLLNQYRQKQYLELVKKLVKKTDMAQMDRFTEFCVNQAYDRWSHS